MSERSEHCDTDVSLNKLTQLREAAAAATDRKIEVRTADESFLVPLASPENLRFIVAADPDTIIALLDALDDAEEALTMQEWKGNPEDYESFAAHRAMLRDRALAKLAALKGES